jgi:membrane protein DedA with SNARE-associated domain
VNSRTAWRVSYNVAMLEMSFEESETGSVVEISGILLTSFLLNIIPFAGPSNLLIASTIALKFTDVDPLMIGFLVAFGAASAKFIHYLVMFFAGRYIGEKRLKRIEAASPKLRKWAPIALFVVAATPIPDEPVIIPLGLIRYNPGKLFIAYFLGKLVIGVAGAYFGVFTHHILGSMMDENVLIVISIVLTVIVTVILLKVDVSKLAERIFKRKITLR